MASFAPEDILAFPGRFAKTTAEGAGIAEDDRGAEFDDEPVAVEIC